MVRSYGTEIPCHRRRSFDQKGSEVRRWTHCRRCSDMGPRSRWNWLFPSVLFFLRRTIWNQRPDRNTGVSSSGCARPAWADVFSSLFLATIGLLVITLALKAFRRGERWAWYAMLVFVAAGILNSVFDYLEWGGWFTFFFYGLWPLLGVLLSTKSFFGKKSSDDSPPS